MVSLLDQETPVAESNEIGLHFTNLAYTVFFQELMKTINKTWPDQMPEKLPYVLPAWNDASAWPQMTE